MSYTPNPRRLPQIRKRVLVGVVDLESGKTPPSLLLSALALAFTFGIFFTPPTTSQWRW
jgi:hypothetical protein